MLTVTGLPLPSGRASAPAGTVGPPARTFAAGRRAALAIAALFAAALAFYSYGAAPTVLYGDSAELQIVGLTGGIPHAPGYPTYAMVSRIFGKLPVAADPARRITLMSCFFAATAVALVALALLALGTSPGGAIAGAAIYSLSFVFWRSALRAEVYTLAVTIALLALWRTIVALRSPRFRDSALAAVFLGLTLTGHLSYFPLAAAGGLALAWRALADRAPQRLPALLATFGLGLAPFLYLAWADGRPYPYNYLRIVELVSNQFVRRNPDFDTAWERAAWMVLGRNMYPTEPVSLALHSALRSLFRAGAAMVLFDPGPVAAALVPLGFARLARIDRPAAWTLAGATVFSLVFASLMGVGNITTIFLMPCVLVATLFAGVGLDAVRARWPQPSSRGAWAAATGALAVGMVVAPAHGLRARAATHSIGPWGLWMHEKGDLYPQPALPFMRHLSEPRRYGEQAMAKIPPDALVIGGWAAHMNLLYFQAVKGLRPDLTLQPISDGYLKLRLEEWERRHSLDRHPIVFLDSPFEVRGLAPEVDSVAVASGRRLYIQRTPLRWAGPE